MMKSTRCNNYHNKSVETRELVNKKENRNKEQIECHFC